MYVLDVTSMFLVNIKFIRHYVDTTSSRQVFSTFEECEDYIKQFPRYIVEDWSICPLTEQNPIKSKKDVRRPHLLNVKVTFNDSSIKWYMNVHPDNFNDVFMSGARLNGVYKLEVRVNEF